MRLSQLFGNRYKERPAEAVLDSHALLLRGGYIRPAANGVFILLPPGQRVLKNLERLLREAWDAWGGQEIQPPPAFPEPVAPPAGATRFADHSGNGMISPLTFEEVAAALCRTEISSYAQLPCLLYLFQSIFHDKPRSWGGLLQSRAAYINEAYLFQASPEELEASTERAAETLTALFQKTGLEEIVLCDAAPVAEGETHRHGLVWLSEAGEDLVAGCDTCSYRARLEAARGRFAAWPETPRPLEKVHTPGMKTIDELAGFLHTEPRQTAKVVCYESDAEGRPVLALVRGDLEVNEDKLRRIIGQIPVPAQEETIRSFGAVPGFATPMGLDTQRFRLLVDTTVFESNNLVCGANEIDYHFLNFNAARDLPGVTPVDLATATEGAGCPHCAGTLDIRKGFVLAEIAAFGTGYAETRKMAYTDAAGRACTPVMAGVRIDLGRWLGAAAEARHDRYGPQWAMPIAPWQAHLSALKHNVPAVRECAEALYAALRGAGIETLYDDRNASPGVQFADGDLLGAPIRITVSEKHLADGHVEYKRRDSGEKGVLPVAQAVETLLAWIHEPL